jgi:uncharacterized membrane protein YidH (DUF202 family)
MTELSKLIAKVNKNIINPFIYMLLAVAFVIFVWGVIEFIKNADNAEERETGKMHMIWGVIGLVIMVSFAGIIGIIKNFLGL